LVANINVDRLGRGSDTLYAVGARRQPSTLAAQVSSFARMSNQVLDWSWDRADDRWQRDCRSDHVNYRAAGIPALTINSAVHGDWRTINDTVDKVDFARYAQRVTWLAGLIREVGNAAEQPRVTRGEAVAPCARR
jgi:hypothetical protein